MKEEEEEAITPVQWFGTDYREDKREIKWCYEVNIWFQSTQKRRNRRKFKDWAKTQEWEQKKKGGEMRRTQKRRDVGEALDWEERGKEKQRKRDSKEMDRKKEESKNVSDR